MTNRKLSISAAFICLHLLSGGLYADYCPASGGSWEYIQDFHLAMLHRNNTGRLGYDDQTGTAITLEQGLTYQLLVVNGAAYDGDQCRVWIDWNGDEIFDANETIPLTNSLSTPNKFFYTTLTIGPDTPIGIARLRMRITGGTPFPCGVADGEVEDYSINVIAPDTNAILYESAVMGQMDQMAGQAFNSVNHLGVRFELQQPAEITAIGSHIKRTSATDGIMRLSIFALDGPDDFPDDSSPAEMFMTFLGPEASMDFRIALSEPTLLQAGWYAIVVRYDTATGAGIMPFSGQSAIGAPSFIARNSSGWYNMPASPPIRFVLEGRITYSCGEPNTPSNPIPWNGVEGVSLTPQLRWVQENEWTCRTMYDVYLGKIDPPAVAASNLINPSYTCGPLDANSTYYWKIVAKTDQSQKFSPVWSFKTDDQAMPLYLPKYHIIDLGVIKELDCGGLTCSSSRSYAINESGDVVGGVSTGLAATEKAFLWHDANSNGEADTKEMVSIGAFYSDGPTYAKDVSDNGLIVGNYGKNRNNSALKWRDQNGNGIVEQSETQKLPYPAGSIETFANACNNCGKVAGAYRTDFSGPLTACLWDVQTDTATTLGTLGGYSCKASAVNDAGFVTGSSDCADSNYTHAYIWIDENTDGEWNSEEMIELSDCGGHHSAGLAINNKGRVVGYADDVNEWPHAFFWSDDNSNGFSEADEMRNISTSEGLAGVAMSINDHDQVVGELYRYGIDPNSGYAFYWDKTNGIVELLKLACNRGNWLCLASANHINNRGWIVGEGHKPNRVRHAYLMIPEYSAADLTCDGRVNLEDYSRLAGQWLLAPAPTDLCPPNGDGITNLKDFAIFANAWNSTYSLWPWDARADIEYDQVIDMKDFAVLAGTFLNPNSINADIAPTYSGDNAVNMLDFVLMADNWLAGCD